MNASERKDGRGADDPSSRWSARRVISATVRALALAMLTLVLLVVLLVGTGHDPWAALSALVRGAFGSWYAITSATLVRTVPLGLAGLAVAIAFRAGILNIGAEGQLLIGASASAAVFAVLGVTSAVVSVPLMLVTGMLAGGAWAAMAAFLKQRFGVLEVISTIMLNFVAQSLIGWLVRGPLQEPTHIAPQSTSLPDALHLPRLLPNTQLHVGFLLLVVLAVAMWWWLRSTASGFRVRATGANSAAAASSGQINVARTTAGVFVLSGALAGLGGAVEYTGVTYALYDNFSPGYGYTAIAVALLAGLHPLGVLATALLFGALEAGASAMQRDAGVPSVVVSVVEASLILLVVAAQQWQSRAAKRVEARA